MAIATDNGFVRALVTSTSMTFMSELGDKTWLIAVIMAMRHSRLAVFVGAMIANVVLTLISG